MQALRLLKFADLVAAAAEAEALLASGYRQQGKWSLGQICRHLCLVQDPSIDGYPRWMSFFAFLRPIVRRILLPKILSDDSPRGIPTSAVFQPPSGLDDRIEVHRFVNSVARFRDHVGGFTAHPGFGRLDRETLQRVHSAHAAHHLRFLTPNTDAWVDECSSGSSS